jgi:coatomer protein complex subunit alpha (xenin)
MAEHGGWDNTEEIRISHASIPTTQDDFAEFVEAPTNPLLQTSVPGLHLLAGSIDSAKKLLTAQAGIVDFAPLDPLFNEASKRNVLGSTVNRFEDVDPVFSPADVQEALEAALQATTEGRFLDAITSFERALHLSLLVVALEPAGKDQLALFITEAREYLLGLHMELARKEIIASNAELAGPTATRVLELACYFTACKLRPAHLVLALRSAMTLAFKLKQVGLSARMAQRLIDLNPGESIAAQAQKVLAVAASQHHQSLGPVLDLQYDDHLDFDLDAAKFAPIYLGQPALECPHCGALYGESSDKATICRICKVASVGATASGLQICP